MIFSRIVLLAIVVAAVWCGIGQTGAHAQVAASDPTHPNALLRRNNLKGGVITTESGWVVLAYNRGFTDGSNNAKLFGKNSSATLWSDARRRECFAQALRMIAQLDAVQSERTEAEELAWLAESWGEHAGHARELAELSRSLDAWKTNYVRGDDAVKRLANRLTKQLRHINPKSRGGIPIQPRNLQAFATALDTLATTATVGDFALGAALEQALAGDAALARLDYIEAQARAMAERTGMEFDPALVAGYEDARAALTRSEHYYGALMTELTDRRYEVARLAGRVVLRAIHKEIARVIVHHLMKHGMTKVAATKISLTAGPWVFAVTETVMVVLDLLEHYHQAQVGVAAASIAGMMAQVKAAGLLEEDRPEWTAMIHQGEAVYCDQMVKMASTGWGPYIRDLLSPGRAYADVREEYDRLGRAARQRAAEMMTPERVDKKRQTPNIPIDLFTLRRSEMIGVMLPNDAPPASRPSEILTRDSHGIPDGADDTVEEPGITVIIE